MAGHLLGRPDAQEPEATQEGEPQVPSILSVTNNHVIGAADVSLPAPDGSRRAKLITANGLTVIDLALSQELCAYLVDGLTAIEVIEQGEEAEADAPAG